MPLPPLSSVIATHQLQAKKSLGQHFLLDEHVLDRIAGYAGNITEHNVIEIGPGPGGLTRALLARGAHKVIAVEKDVRCIAAIQELQHVYPQRLEIVAADALRLDVTSLCSPPRKIVANLPYNVGTQLLVNWLDQLVSQGASAFESFTLMFQKEVAERITALPRTKEYGRLSIYAQWLCNIEWHEDLPPHAFSPPPKIDSSVITLTPLAHPRFPADAQMLQKVVATAFNQRRKMLRVALKPLGVDTAELLHAAQINPECRAEELSVEAFCRLSSVFAAQSKFS